MLNLTYGNEVTYITCNIENLNTVPVLDGQIITFYDADGIYYDMEGYRHCVGNFSQVNVLPKKGVTSTLYILIQPNKQPNLYVWNSSTNSYISLIPEQAIKEDAPDNFLYLRSKGKWVHDTFTYYIDENKSADDTMDDIQLYILSTDCNYIKIVGNLKKPSSCNGISANVLLDFTSCDTSEWAVTDTEDRTSNNWYEFQISNSRGIIGFTGSYIDIDLDASRDDLDIYVKDCHFIDSRICINDSSSRVDISNNIFSMSHHNIVPILDMTANEGSNISIIGNTFAYSTNIDSWPGCAIILSKSGLKVVESNILRNSFVLKCIAPGGLADKKSKLYCNVQSFIKPAGDDTRVIDYEFLNIDKNENDLLHNTLDMSFVSYVCKSPNPYSILRLGDILSVNLLGLNITLGVADITVQNDITVIKLEINPESFTSKDDATDIVNKLNSSLSSFEYELNKMYASQMVDISSFYLSNNEKFYGEELLPIYSNDKQYKHEVDSTNRIKYRADGTHHIVRSFLVDSDSSAIAIVKSNSYYYLTYKDSVDSISQSVRDYRYLLTI